MHTYPDDKSSSSNPSPHGKQAAAGYVVAPSVCVYAYIYTCVYSCVWQSPGKLMDGGLVVLISEMLCWIAKSHFSRVRSFVAYGRWGGFGLVVWISQCACQI